jgi:hypothetical protein
LISECSNKRTVKAVNTHTFYKEAEKFKQALSARKLMANIFGCAGGGIYATKNHNNVTSALRNTKETA